MKQVQGEQETVTETKFNPKRISSGSRFYMAVKSGHETKEYKKTIGSRDEIRETHRRM
jgi:hypothetical protein